MRDKQLLILCVALPVVLSLLVGYAVATAQFSFRHPEGRKLTVTREGRVVAPPAVTEKQNFGTASNERKPPRAFVAEAEHDFGVMDPLTMGSHTFVITNTGELPLSIKKGPTSCKCTLSKMVSGDLSPGEQTQVTLEWNTGRDRFYSHQATIFTNDPIRPTLELRIRGRVSMRIGIDPPELDLPSIHPDETASSEVVLYSQVWDALDFRQTTSSLEGLDWQITRAPESVRASYKAKVAYLLRVTTPASMPQGSFLETLNLKARPPVGADAEFEAFELPIRGKVLRRLAIYGPGIDHHGVLDLGQIAQGNSVTKRWLVRVRDDAKELRTTGIQVEPSFLQARLTSSPNEQLAYLEVVVPEDAETCYLRGRSFGTIHMEFDHPRVPSLDLRVQLAVTKALR